MKRILLLTFIASLFAAGSAFAHCGACTTGDQAHAKGDKAKMECTEKATCPVTGATACETKACDTKAKGEMAACPADCSAKCCAKAEAKEEAVASSPPACCPAGKSGKSNKAA